MTHENRLPTEQSYIAVTGPVAAGKTNLARLLAQNLDAHSVFEPFESNPFLGMKEHPRYAFETSTHFLLLHMHALKKASLEAMQRRFLISDFYIPHDRFFAEVELSANELKVYDTVLSQASQEVPQPAAIVALDASWETTWNRILERNRSYEIELGASFYRPIHQRFHEWLDSEFNPRVIRVDAEDASLLNSGGTVQLLATRILELVGGRP